MKKSLLLIMFMFFASAGSYSQVCAQTADLAAGISLLQNYPEPFGGSTAIKFILKEEYIASISVVLETCFKEALNKIDPEIIFQLLLHPEILIQGFAGKLLVLRELDPSLVSDKIIFSHHQVSLLRFLFQLAFVVHPKYLAAN